MLTCLFPAIILREFLYDCIFRLSADTTELLDMGDAAPNEATGDGTISLLCRIADFLGWRNKSRLIHRNPKVDSYSHMVPNIHIVYIYMSI